MRVGIVGARLQAKRRSAALANLSNVEVAIISAEHMSSAESLADEIGCEADSGWEWVSKRDDIDVVLVCTPPHLHHAISIAALESGKHVLCEKPLSRTLDEAVEMSAVASETGLSLKCGFNHRHHPGVQMARKWIDEGRIGDLLFIRCRYGICGRPGYESEWRTNPSIVSGGHLMEQGIHAIDLSRWFLGEFKEVNCFISTQYWQTGDLEDNGFALYRTDEGCVASIHSSLTQWKNLFSFEIFGRDGYVVIEGLGGSYGTQRVSLGKRDFDAPFGDQVVEFRGGDRSWLHEWEEFVDAIQMGREPVGSATDGVEAMRLVMAAYEAARRGVTVSVHGDCK